MKIIGSDYDGTLNHNGIDDKKKKAIQSWRDAGNIFALISGRGIESVLEIYKEKQFPCDYLIADNGAVIMKTDGSIISDVRCDAELTVPLFKLLFKCGCRWGHIQTSFSCRIYDDADDCEDDDEFTLENMPDIPYFNQISTELPDFETAAEVTACIKEHFGKKLNPLQNGTCIDIVRADMNKAKGLYILMEHLGANYDDIIVVGDNINDRDMIKEFRSYAMENGVDVIKELADYVTPGVAELISKELAQQSI
ncbi:MAG: HAD hydrolase family protein [Clostridia bacterium]|nr:HAD hydrolase family protein [Clostridia bacterium]